MGVLNEASKAQVELVKVNKDLIEINKDLLKETKTNNRATSRQNRLTIILSVAIIALGVCTVISQIFPIFEYKVISSSYLVRINKISGKIKYIDITKELDKATDESWEKATNVN